MTWTYSLALTDARDQVRLLVGDTDSNDQQLQDEEVDYFVSAEANTYMAASRCAAALASKYARKADKSVGDLKISYKGIAEGYFKLMAELKSKGMTHQKPSAGGIYVGDSQAAESNSGLRHNTIKRGLTDYVADPTGPNTETS